MPRSLYHLFLLAFISLLAWPQVPAQSGKPGAQDGGKHDLSSPESAKSKDQQQKQAEEFDVLYAQAMSLRRAHDFQAALVKFQKAEQLAEDLGDTKFSWLQEILAGEADCFTALKKYQQAEQALLRRKEALRISTKELDESYAHSFSLLADLAAKQEDWSKTEIYLQQAIKAHDKIIASVSSSETSALLARDEWRAKALDMFHMGFVYSRQGKYADALSIIEDAFNLGSAAKLPKALLVQMATAGKEIAVHTGFPDDAGKWQKRLGGLPVSVENSKH